MGKYKSDWAKLNNILRSRKWREENPERCKQTKRNWYLKNQERLCEKERNRSRFKLYGLTEEEYKKMLYDHLNKCAICGGTNDSIKKSLSVDHDHKTGEVRGLLCAGCNFLVGRIEDLGLENIIEYFNKYNIK